MIDTLTAAQLLTHVSALARDIGPRPAQAETTPPRRGAGRGDKTAGKPGTRIDPPSVGNGRRARGAGKVKK